MPTDPLAEIATIKAAYEAVLAKSTSLAAALAAAQQANPSSDFVTPDVQSALDALNAEVTSQGSDPVTAPSVAAAAAPSTPASS